MPNQVANASIVANSSVSASAGAAHTGMAFVVATSQVMANGYAHFHVASSMPGGASLSPNPLGNYKGTVARILALNASVSANPAAHYQARELIQGNSTFTTWVILLFSGAFGGSGTLSSGPPVRILTFTGALTGAGFLDVTYQPGTGMVGTATVSATPTVTHTAQAIIKGGASVTANATIGRFGAALHAGSSVSASASLHSRIFTNIFGLAQVAASGSTQTVTMAGGASLTAQAHVRQGARATAIAGSSVSATGAIPTAKFASAAIKGAAAVDPAGVALPGGPAAFIVAGSSVAAHATLDHVVHPLYPLAPVQTLILGAQFTGAGTLQDKLLIALAGTLSGAGTISASTLIQLLALRPLPLVGQGGIHDSSPLPMVGYGFLLSTFDIVRVPRPFCPPRNDKVFRYGYILTRGDLELRVCDDSGNPYAPVVVLYAFYQIVPGGQRMLVGPPNRRPAIDKMEGKVGRYYATGTAGELGQPGEWVIVWRFQRSWWTPTQFVEEHFKVVDEVTSCEPGALSGRCIKYGWL